MDWTALIGYLITPVVGAAGWVVGGRMRRNSALNTMQDTINMLVDKNAELVKEISELREANAILKAGQAEMLEQLTLLRKSKDGGASYKIKTNTKF